MLILNESRTEDGRHYFKSKEDFDNYFKTFIQHNRKINEREDVDLSFGKIGVNLEYMRQLAESFGYTNIGILDDIGSDGSKGIYFIFINIKNIASHNYDTPLYGNDINIRNGVIELFLN